MSTKNQPIDLAPETHNEEQDDESSQAQDVAEDALHPDAGTPTESTKHKKGAYEDDDSTQDLVDHMRDMESSGRIDMGAYRGEPNMDDDDDKYGDKYGDKYAERDTAGRKRPSDDS